MNISNVSVAALAACALSDLAATPLLLGSDGVPAAVGVGVTVVGVLTLVAAYGVWRAAPWARPLAFGTRGIDILGLVPVVASGAGGAETSAAAVTFALSVVAIASLLRLSSRSARTA